VFAQLEQRRVLVVVVALEDAIDALERPLRPDELETRGHGLADDAFFEPRDGVAPDEPRTFCERELRVQTARGDFNPPVEVGRRVTGAKRLVEIEPGRAELRADIRRELIGETLNKEALHAL